MWIISGLILFVFSMTGTEDAQKVNGTAKVGGAEDAEVGFTHFAFDIYYLFVFCSGNLMFLFVFLPSVAVMKIEPRTCYL